MFEELTGKKVKVYIGVGHGISETVRGDVLDVKDLWMKVQVKENVELINLNKVSRIIVAE